MSGQRKQVSALGYALPLIIALAVVGSYAAYAVNRAKGTLGASSAQFAQPSVDPGEERWLKGALHVHTNQSGDSQEPVPNVVAAYEKAGFDFIVLTDHNHVTVGQGTKGMLVIPGAELTQNLASCEPPPEDDHGCAVHVNALFADPRLAEKVILDPKSPKRLDLYRAELEAAKALGALSQLNHPNYRYTAADPKLIAELARGGVRFIEVANEAKDVNTDGDAQHPPVEALWDAALGEGAVIYGTATDDAHDYSNLDQIKGRNPSIVDQGYVFVRAKKDAQSIRDALEQGRFYTSNGATLSEVKVEEGRLLISAEADSLIRFIGEGGAELARSNGTQGSIALSEVKGRYVRAVIEQQGKKAWTQPVFRPTEAP